MSHQLLEVTVATRVLRRVLNFDRLQSRCVQGQLAIHFLNLQIGDHRQLEIDISIIQIAQIKAKQIQLLHLLTERDECASECRTILLVQTEFPQTKMLEVGEGRLVVGLEE